MPKDQVTRRGRQGVYDGDCERCSLMMMRDDPNRGFVRDDFKRHTDKTCPRCRKRR
jgi:hypothetical protein